MGCTMSYLVYKTELGYYSLKTIPTQEELEDYYEKKYYQQSRSTYEKKYSSEEKLYLLNQLELKNKILDIYLKNNNNEKKFLDVGCGEGWALSFFKKLNWSVKGLDYSNFGCRQHNPDCVQDIIVGDIFKNLRCLIDNQEKFDVILLDNVLEHVIDPISMLQDLKSISNENTILIIEVPNDFSVLQQYLRDKGKIDNDFWVVSPDHLSYFNKESLANLCNFSGWEQLKVIGDYPIDINLFNINTNYVKNKSVGKSCYHAKIEVDNLLHTISIEKKINLYETLADMGLGRQIISFFSLK